MLDIWCCLVLQTSARRNGTPIDSLAFEHGIVNLEEREISGPPKEGVYVKGLFLEGGRGAGRGHGREGRAAPGQQGIHPLSLCLYATLAALHSSVACCLSHLWKDTAMQ